MGPQSTAARKRVLKGIPASPGIVIGKAHRVDRSRVKIFYQYLVNQSQVEREVERFAEALRAEEAKLLDLKRKLPVQAKEPAFLLDSHLMILKDSMLREATVQKIREEKINAEWALTKTLQEITEIFDQIEDDYISERIRDVEAVTDRILRHLMGMVREEFSVINERVIVVAHDLSPADTTELNMTRVQGFITDVGGRTSHTSIMAQAFQIPAVVGLESVTREVNEGDLLIVDGYAGEVLIHPDDADIVTYQERQLRQEKYKTVIARTTHLPSETLDGARIRILANIELPEEAGGVREWGAEGIGLYRTEFHYLRGGALPGEEELFQNYRDIACLMAPDPVIIRTLDLGGEKLSLSADHAVETNPALGLRAIRLCLKETKLFRTQLRAILRASVHGRIHLMFPMISGLTELLRAKEILAQVTQELDRDGIHYDHTMPVGIMIEVPSAAAIADILAQHADFFSIGTNDLIQYGLAIDRINEHVAYLYQPFHPAVLRMIRSVVTAGQNAGIEVSVCGEMAGDPLCVPVLVGLGIDVLSMNPRVIPLVKKVIRSLSLDEARRDVDHLMDLETAGEVRAYLLERMKAILPELEDQEYLLYDQAEVPGGNAPLSGGSSP